MMETWCLWKLVSILKIPISDQSTLHRVNIIANVSKLSTDCGWSVSVVAHPPETLTKKCKPLVLIFKDKNGRDPPANPNLKSAEVSEKPILIDRGLQFYREVLDNFEKILTPTKVRTSVSRDTLEVSSYISPTGTTVLSLTMDDLQNTLTTLPTEIIRSQTSLHKLFRKSCFFLNFNSSNIFANIFSHC